MDISNHIYTLIGKKCWTVIAGSGTGSVVHLGLGEKKLKSKPLSNPVLSEDEKKYDSEFEVMIYCAWRLTKLNEVICGWRDSNELGESMLNGLIQLKGKKIIDITLNSSTYDLDIKFENELFLQLFCDQTNDFESDENYTLFINSCAYTVGLKSILEYENNE